MNNFRSNSEEETYVLQHMFETGFDQSYAPTTKNVSASKRQEEKGNSSNAHLKYISQWLMDEEEEEESGQSMLHDSLSLQATEKSLYDELNNNHPDTANDPRPNISSAASPLYFENPSPISSAMKRIWCDLTASNHVADEPEHTHMYDDILLYTKSDRTSGSRPDALERRKAKKKGRRQSKRRKQGFVEQEVVDLRSLLMQSAEAAANFDNRSLNDLLLRIRKHSSPQGNSVERVAHWFSNALEARMAGTGSSLYAKLDSKRISAKEMLIDYRMFFKACPFWMMTNLFAATTIGNLVRGRATSPSKCWLHVIDFGIMNGYQWPYLIQALASIPGGPPKLRITGIDFPRPGLRSAEKVVETGGRLANFCKRFGVPFVYNAIAQQWDTIQAEDLKIQKNELLVVNSMYRFHHLPGEAETINSPRDTVLRLIKKINPDVFIHGIINASYTVPFFVTRFKEAFYHFSSLFDMLEATVPAEDDAKRLLYEEQMLGKQVINAIACEGEERIERPETYKHWQLRMLRSGFRQLQHDPEIVRRVINERAGYHKNFSVEEDGKWILLGWKGRVIHAISCWEPDNIAV